MPTRRKYPWKPEDDATVVQMETAKVSRRIIADQLDRTQAGVEARIMRLRRQGVL